MSGFAWKKMMQGNKKNERADKKSVPIKGSSMHVPASILEHLIHTFP